jgi:hypothetical protein
MSSDAETEMMELDCPHCGAKVGEWCYTTAGARASYLHSARFYAWRDTARANTPDWPPVR